MEKTRILTELRSQTRPQHDSVEQNRYSKALMDGTMNLQHYKDFLQKFYGFHSPLEHALERLPWDTVGINFDDRRKIPMLVNDLRAFGLSDEEITSLPKVNALALPPMTTLEEGVGVMYVMEGSTLGGQIQSRKVRTMFGIDPNDGSAYFSSYGANVSTMWKTFCEAITSVADNDAVKESIIIESAKKTFASLETWLAM